MDARLSIASNELSELLGRKEVLAARGTTPARPGEGERPRRLPLLQKRSNTFRPIRPLSQIARESIRFSFSGAFFRPQPFQQRLPIWLGGNSQAAIDRAVRVGDGWQPSNADFDACGGLC